jgi:hypothetical protein
LATTRKSKVKPPQQITVLSRDVAVLRKIDMRFPKVSDKARKNLVEMLRLTQLEPNVPEGEMPWFADGYISNDMPRDFIITQAIMGATLGFAVARTDTGEILREYGKDELAKADRAVANVKPQLAIEVDIEDEDDEAPAPEAAATEDPVIDGE